MILRLLLIVAALSLCSCGSARRAAQQSVPTPSATVRSASTTPGPVTESPPSAAAASPESADEVALQGVKALLASDTTLDQGLNGTARRAVSWLSPSFAASVLASISPGAPGAQWEEWTAHQAYVQVVTSLGSDDRPADSQLTAVRQVIATLTPVGRDGWQGATSTVTEFVVLVPFDGQWRIDSAQQR